jgi:transcription antitermination protein NusB
MASPRRRAREMALLALYEMDVAGHDPSTALERLCDTHSLKPEQRDFARTLLAGVLAGIAEIDGVIERTAPQWPAQQLSPVDRNILRVAIREFLVDNLTPAGAAINEAVDLAKKYGSENSGRFVNGVLGSVSTAGRPVVQEGK